MAAQVSSATDNVDTNAFREVLRAVVGSVSIVAAGQEDEKRGLAVTAAVSLCLEPPMVLVCINKNADAHDVILESGSFSWNVLSVDQIELAKCFASMDGSKGAARFSSTEWGQMSTGCPVLLQSVCSFDCKVQSTLVAGTHTVVTGAVVAQGYNKEKTPLIYSFGKFGRANLEN